MNEVPTHLEDQVNQIWDDYFKREISEKKSTIEGLDSNKVHDICDLQEQVRDLNSVIYQYVGPENEALYTAYKTHLIHKGDQFLIIEGEELDTDPDIKKGE